MKKIAKPIQGTYPVYFEKYYSHLPQGKDVFELFTEVNMDTIDLFTSVDIETLLFRYAPEKWTMKEILQHLMDSERVFAYRAMRIARQDLLENAGYDENAYALTSNANQRNIMDMVREYSLLRASTIELFKSFTDEALLFIGNANGYKVTPAALAYAIVAHEMHHMKVIDTLYLPK